jgi:hypothetical protein
MLIISSLAPKNTLSGEHRSDDREIKTTRQEVLKRQPARWGEHRDRRRTQLCGGGSRARVLFRSDAGIRGSSEPASTGAGFTPHGRR